MSSDDPYDLDLIEEEYQQQKVLSEQDKLEVRVTSVNVYKIHSTYEIVIRVSALDEFEYIGIITANNILSSLAEITNPSSAPKWIKKLNGVFFELGAGEIEDDLQKLVNQTTSLSGCEEGINELHLDGNDLTLTRVDHVENPTIHTDWGKKQPTTRYETMEARDRLPERLMKSVEIYHKSKYLSKRGHRADIEGAAVMYDEVRIIISPASKVNYMIRLDFHERNINKLMTIFTLAGEKFSRDLSNLVGKSIPISSDDSANQMHVDTDNYSIEANFFSSGNIQMSASDSQIPDPYATSAERLIRYDKEPGPAEASIADVSIIDEENNRKILKVGINLFGQRETFEMIADPSNDRFRNFVETVGYGSVNQVTDGEVYVLRVRDSTRNQENEEVVQQFQEDIFDIVSDEFSVWYIMLSEETATSINSQIKRKDNPHSSYIQRSVSLIFLFLIVLLTVATIIWYT